ncbi:MAG: DUF4404 family protein [Pirellulales bacterium]
MSDLKERIRATVRDLEQELAAAGPLDNDSRQLLEQAAQEIRAKLGVAPGGSVPGSSEASSAAAEPGSLVERINTAARRFESTHPTLSGILERIADGLAQLGI